MTDVCLKVRNNIVLSYLFALIFLDNFNKVLQSKYLKNLLHIRLDGLGGVPNAGNPTYLFIVRKFIG